MEVTSDLDAVPRTATRLVEEVLRELQIARKSARGLTPDSMGEAKHLTTLLGNGNPSVAFGQLTSHLLKDGDIALLAAAYSLGLASEAASHLGRLVDFGQDYGFEQRQARRYSDQGLRYIASRSATTWASLGAPRLHLQAIQPTQSGSIDLYVSTLCASEIWMNQPTVERLVEGTWTSQSLQQLTANNHDRSHRRYEPLQLESQLGIRWTGEMTPTVGVELLGGFDNVCLSWVINGGAVYVRCEG